jgi:acetyl-CoA synthetase
MTRGFLGDRDRYLATYFTRFGDRVWCHGDWARVDANGQWFVTGRSDDTLKIAGKRVGPGEVEAAAISHPAVREAAAIGLADVVKGTRLVVVAVATEGADASAKLGAEVAAHIGSRLGASMRPAAVIWTSALPVTRSGKILRGLIRQVLAGEAPTNLTTLANPDALAALVDSARESPLT